MYMLNFVKKKTNKNPDTFGIININIVNVPSKASCLSEHLCPP